MVLYIESFNESKMWFRIKKIFLPMLQKPTMPTCVFNFWQHRQYKTEFQLASKQFPCDYLNKTYEYKFFLPFHKMSLIVGVCQTKTITLFMYKWYAIQYFLLERSPVAIRGNSTNFVPLWKLQKRNAF